METVTISPSRSWWGAKRTAVGGPTSNPMPGVMAYGATREAALAAVRSLGLRVVADCIEHGEEVPAQFVQVFSEA